jgi:hypothetical protein
VLESVTSLTAVAQQAVFIAALTASSSIAFEAAVRGYRGPPARPPRRVEVALAHTRDALADAEAIVREQYRGRGYHFPDETTAGGPYAAHRPGHVILARDDDSLVGTLTLGLDSRAGMLVEESHPEAVAAARAEGRRLGEVVRFAVRDSADSRSVLAAMFNAAHGLSTVHQLDDLYIEVNPRHVGFYRRALCFQVAAEERVCPRVGAPSVLMRLELQALSAKIGQLESALGSMPAGASAA